MSEHPETAWSVAPPPQPAVPPARHPLNIAHLVMGVALLGLVVVWALVVSDAVGGSDVRWLLPVPWVLAGLAGLVGLVASDRRRHVTRRVGWEGPPRPAPAPAAGQEPVPGPVAEEPSDTMER